MKKNVSPLQRLMVTILTIFLTVGLGLIGPASALADGVETGGLNFTIVSDEITKTATGSVPVVAGTDLAGLESGSGGEGRDTVSGAATTGGEDGIEPAPEPTPVLASTTTGGTGNSGKGNGTASGTVDGTVDGTDSGTGGSDYNTSNTFSDKNATNKTTGKKAYAKW